MFGILHIIVARHISFPLPSYPSLFYLFHLEGELLSWYHLLLWLLGRLSSFIQQHHWSYFSCLLPIIIFLIQLISWPLFVLCPLCFFPMSFSCFIDLHFHFCFLFEVFLCFGFCFLFGFFLSFNFFILFIYFLFIWTYTLLKLTLLAYCFLYVHSFSDVSVVCPFFLVPPFFYLWAHCSFWLSSSFALWSTRSCTLMVLDIVSWVCWGT